MYQHCEFLEYWNTQKIVWRVWQRFFCLLDKGIPKIWQKLNSSDGFLSYLQNSTANSAHMGAHFCLSKSALQSHREKSISSIFLESPHQRRHEKCCQILQTIFWVFQYSRNSYWLSLRILFENTKRQSKNYILVTFGEHQSQSDIK